MWAAVSGAEVLAVPTAAVVARGTAGLPERGRIAVALASKRGTAWITVLEREAGGPWSVPGTPGLMDASGVSGLRVDAAVADRYLPDDIRQIFSDSQINIIDPGFDARACIQVVAFDVSLPTSTPPERLLPLYPREPEAVTRWRDRRS